MPNDAALDAACRRHDFADREAFHRARLAPDAFQATGERLAALEEAAASAAGALEETARAIEGVERPDLARLADEARAAAAARDRAIDGRAKAESALHRDQKRIEALERLERALAKKEQAFRPLARLAELANGKNDRKLTFQRYVLGALLDDALDEASRRLARMSRGRYALRRAHDPLDRRKGGGLDLEVEDHQSGLARPARSLSGGESFLASLALALGMADTATRRAGGVRVDCLFIDEGFGALDPEALDLAIDALTHLRAHGRMIGVVSHVPEMRERMPLRLEVSPGPHGARAVFRGLPSGARDRR